MSVNNTGASALMGIKDSIYCSELCIQVMQLPPVTPTESVCED